MCWQCGISRYGEPTKVNLATSPTALTRVLTLHYTPALHILMQTGNDAVATVLAMLSLPPKV